ncbi:MAG: hypothetical protein H0T65_04855 [Deltaproteobacteria bacterium]|nr:hypothetical protein [Deltaproteobacteria bacterium]
MRWVVLAVLVLTADVSANGRAPLTNGVYFRPGDTQSIYVRSTFGLLVSHDDGCSFRWICERAIGYGGEFDPKYAIATDGTIFATTFTGLKMTRDGCTWTTAPVGPGEIWVDAIDIGPNGHVWVATAESAAPNNVYRSTDNGATFVARGMLSPQVWWKSVKVAPSDAQVVYVAGYQVAGAPTARLYRSDNAGDDWTERPLFGEQRDPPTMKFGSTPIVLVAAIDPKDPNIVLLTSIEANPPKGDRLYRSTDGGVTFKQVLATNDKIRDVFYATDGSVYVATLGSGAYRSTDRGAAFTPLDGPPQLGCLGQRSDGALVGCGANWEPDFKAVARTTDATKWQKVFRFVELAGPLQCAAGTTVGDICEPMWPSLKELFGATGPGMCPAIPDGPPKKPSTGGGCCDAGSSSSSGLVLFVALLFWRRRYRPSRQLL